MIQTEVANIIKQKCPNFTPKVGIVLGSGLGKLAEHIENATTIPYTELPNISDSTVDGHEGYFVLGFLRGVPVACLKGRKHYYEGIDNSEATILIRTLKCLGCEILLATNTSGSLNTNVGPGSLVLITDHINFSFRNPLVGKNDDEFGPRFVSMDNAYDPELRKQMLKTAKQQNIILHQGVYIGVLGPSFETHAEIRAFKMLGADVIGMSTVPEIIVARHCGLRVVVVAAIANYAAGMQDKPLSHEETLSGAKQASDKMLSLLENFIATI